MTTTTSIIDTSCHPDVVNSDENVKRLCRHLVSRGSTHQRPRLSGRDGLKCEVSRHSRTLPAQ